MTNPPLPVFRQVLGRDFDLLPPAVQSAHEHGRISLHGTAEAQQFLGPIGHLVCWFMGLPRSGKDIPVTIDFTGLNKGNASWRRNFAGRRYASVFSAGTGRYTGKLNEKMGMITIIFALTAQPDRLRFDIIGAKLLGIPLPSCLSPRCIAYESERNGGFVFDIAVDLPILGKLIAYKGVLR